MVERADGSQASWFRRATRANVRTFRLVATAATAAMVLSSGVRDTWASAQSWRVDAARSRLAVHVTRSGALSPALHDHLFVAQRWGGTVIFDPEQPARVSAHLTFATNSLHDVEQGLSPRDIATVDAQVRSPVVLDATRFPQATLDAGRLEPAGAASSNSLRGTLFATLTLHGQTRSLRIPVEANWSDRGLRVRGRVAFKQSDFGIRPYHRALGTIAVRDTVTVEFDLIASPSTAAP